MTRYSSILFLAGLIIGTSPALAQETLSVVADGSADQALPGAWTQQDGFVAITSGSQGLLAARDLGTGDFRIEARLHIPAMNATGASLQLGESVFGLDGPNRKSFLAGALAGGHHVPLHSSGKAAGAGAWLDLVLARSGSTIEFSINGEIIHTLPSFAPIGQVGIAFAPVGRLTHHLADNTIQVRHFVIEGNLQPATSVIPGGYNIPLIDLAHETHRQILVDREPGQYLGHPTTVLLDDSSTILTVYPKGHGRGSIVMKRSTDRGLTWSDRLPVPENWATSMEVPTLFPVTDPSGIKRLIMFSGLYPIRKAVSEDEGRTWTPLEAIGDFGGIVAMSEVIRLSNGDYLAFFHDDGRFINGQEDQRGQFFVYQTRSKDGGLTWDTPRVVVTHAEADLCEPGVIRSPDGQQLAMLLRENSRQFNSFLTLSNDEGATWSTPVELPGALTGDRHQAVYGPDGRLFISFRDRTHVSPTWGDWVGWVGTYDDIIQGREGRYRIRLMDNLQSADTAYPGVELLPDGTVVATTYGHWTAGEEPYIMSVRFTLEELDQRAAMQRR